jgi:hypothetical protein
MDGQGGGAGAVGRSCAWCSRLRKRENEVRKVANFMSAAVRCSVALGGKPLVVEKASPAQFGSSTSSSTVLWTLNRMSAAVSPFCEPAIHSVL